ADRDALLANLYSRAGRLEDAAAVYKTILADPAATPNALVAGASFFATSGQPDLTDRFLDRLQTTSMTPGTIEMLRAQLDEVRGLPQQALQTLTAAAKAHPEVEQVWQELSGFYLRQGNLDEADKAAAAGLKAIPSAAGLSAMRLQIGRMRPLNLRELGSLL